MARTITYTVSLGARGPAGPAGEGGGAELTSYATQIETLPDYPATFPADHAPVTVTGDGISLTGQQISLSIGTGATQVAAGNDSRFTDARTPTAHKTSHATGGSDALTAADIGAVATTGNETIAGAKTFFGQTELTGQAATNDTSAMTRALGDARYGETVFAYKTSDTSRSSADTGTNYTDDPHLQLNLTAGTWEIQTNQAWLAADGTGGMKARLNYTGTWDTASSWFRYWYFFSTNAVYESSSCGFGYHPGQNITNPRVMLALTQRAGGLVMDGQIKLTTSGVLSVQWAQNASSATATTLPKGCYLLAKRIAP